MLSFLTIICVIGVFVTRKQAIGNEVVMNMPAEVVFFLTERCNMKCSFCRGWEFQRKSNAPDMTIGVIKDTLDVFKTIQSVRLGGLSEPLVHPDLPEIIRYVKNRNKPMGMSTNGLYVMRRRQEIPWGYLSSLSFSLNEIDADRHYVQAGVTGFDDVVEGLKFLLSIRPQMQVSFVIEQKNMERIPNYLQFAHEKNIKQVVFFGIIGGHSVGNKAIEDFRSRALFMDDGSLGKIRKKVARNRQRYSNVQNITWPIQLSRKGITKKCGVVSLQISVDGAGNIAACCRGPGPIPRYGNISDGASSWDSPEIVEFRRRVLSSNSDERPTQCRLCHESRR